MSFTLDFAGELKGHGGWVTAIATDQNNPNSLISASRDKTLIKWDLNRDNDTIGKPTKRYTGHSHFVQDVQLSQDGQFAISASWDGTLRLWDLFKGTSSQFRGHKGDVLTVAFSPNQRQVLSGGRDGRLMLWNNLGECKWFADESKENGHAGWVSNVCYSPEPNSVDDRVVAVSCGWDKVVKVWDPTKGKLLYDLLGHTGYVNCATISPDGSLCASGGKDGTAMLWDITRPVHLSSLNAGDEIHALLFSPVRYWLVGATTSGIVIWDLESKRALAQLNPEGLPTPKKGQLPIHPISLAWSHDGSTLFAGYTDNVIRVWNVRSITKQ